MPRGRVSGQRFRLMGRELLFVEKKCSLYYASDADIKITGESKSIDNAIEKGLAVDQGLGNGAYFITNQV